MYIYVYKCIWYFIIITFSYLLIIYHSSFLVTHQLSFISHRLSFITRIKAASPELVQHAGSDDPYICI